jgi:hypothetical protein
VQPVKSETVWLATGMVPAPAHRELATVVPSDWVQETLRVSVAALEQVLESALQEPVVQA